MPSMRPGRRWSGLCGQDHLEIVARPYVENLHEGTVRHFLVGINGNASFGVLRACKLQECAQLLTVHGLWLAVGKRCVDHLLGIDISSAVGNTNVDVTMKNISSRNMTSVIEAIEKSDVMSNCRLSAMAVTVRGIISRVR